MNDTRAALTAAFLLGAAVGAALTWTLAIAKERVRRIRYELRAARKGLKTLKQMLRREAGTLATVAAVVGLLVIGLVVLVTR